MTQAPGDRAVGGPTPTVIDLDSVRPTRTTVIPGANLPVTLERLHVDGRTRASVSLVDFPPGWARPDTGAYGCAEEFVVLHGSLIVSGRLFEPGEWAHLPAGWPRSRSRSRDGARALAFFSGAPVWLPGTPDGPPPRGFVHRRPHGILRDPAPGVQGSVRVETEPPGPAPLTRDILSLSRPHWALVPPGRDVPEHLAGPWLVRLWA